MLRITFAGEDLRDFPSAAFDDHVKIFVPTPSGSVERRDYTPRRYDREARMLVIDFAVHEAGPATQWALRAQPGDTLEIGGPKGSRVVANDEVSRWLLVGDETALPAIGRCIEEARPGADITSVVAVVGSEEHQDFFTEGRLTALWAHRPMSAAADPAALLSAVQTFRLRSGTFIWIAAEASVARVLRRHFLEVVGHPAEWMKAAGYWVAGQADAHETLS